MPPRKGSGAAGRDQRKGRALNSYFGGGEAGQPVSGEHGGWLGGRVGGRIRTAGDGNEARGAGPIYTKRCTVAGGTACIALYR
jgi:hypothetical protein